MKRPSQHFDIIIVGAGTAGCVLATRLTEDPSRSVLLIEAGRHYDTIDAFPEEMLRGTSYAASFPGHPDSWSFMGRLHHDSSLPIVRGKVVGGSSAVNGMAVTRGLPNDYDHWSELGNDKWSFGQVLPYFVKMETDHDVQNAFHGVDGPMPVRRQPLDNLTPAASAFMQACLDAGFPEDQDKNGPDSIGVGRLPLNFVDGIRMNTAITYLEPALARSNLLVADRTEVRRVLFRGTTAIGVEGMRNGVPVTFLGSEVVLSAGAIKTPHLLMLSGIGPAIHLKEHQIEVVHDSPQVGQNLTDHPGFPVTYRARVQRTPPGDVALLQVGLHLGSVEDRSTALHIYPSSLPIGRALVGRRSGLGIATHNPFLTRPMATAKALWGTSIGYLVEESRRGSQMSLRCGIDLPASRGELRLQSADPTVPPELRYNYLSHFSDRAEARRCLYLALDLLSSTAFKSLEAEITAPLPRHVNTDTLADSWIYSHLGTSMHTGCTARMGPDPDSAVVDQYCRVYGVQNLRVIDASIMPELVRRGPFATVLMMAERAAAFFQ